MALNCWQETIEACIHVCLVPLFYLTAGVSDLARLFVNTSKYAGTDL